MSSPEDNKIDFEKIKLSEDLYDSLEPLADESPEQFSSGQQSEIEAKNEVLAEDEETSQQAEFEAGEGAEIAPPSKYRALLEKLSTADPFTVLLAMTAVALLIAILCCLVELGRYHFDIGAKKAKNTVSMTAPIEIRRSST